MLGNSVMVDARAFDGEQRRHGELRDGALLVQLRMPLGVAPRCDVGKRSRSDQAGDANEEEGDVEDGVVSESGSGSGSGADVHTGAKRASANTASDHSSQSKKPKPTYRVRKEQKEALLHALEALEARAEQLRRDVLGVSLSESLSLEAAQRQRCAMQEAVRVHDLHVGGLQSRVSSYVRSQHRNPLHSRIQLGRDLDARKALIIELRREKLRHAHDFLQHRLHGIDETRPYVSEETWTDAAGDYRSVRLDITHFEGVQSEHQVHDALMFYLYNLEISITETLGQLTLQENTGLFDSRAMNQRIVSTTNLGVVQEMNTVTFSEFYEHFEELGGQPYGLWSTDFVDHDELHPYSPNVRVRKEVSAAVCITGYRRRREGSSTTANGTGDDTGTELVVVMKRCVYLTIRKPNFHIQPQAQADLYANIGRWGQAMMKCVREYVYSGARPPE